MYFVIRSGEDGISIQTVPVDKMAAMLKAEMRDHEDKPLAFLASVPEIDQGYFVSGPEGAMLIIEGCVVVPEAVQVATKYSLQ
jgi:hypothetical protein